MATQGGKKQLKKETTAAKPAAKRPRVKAAKEIVAETASQARQHIIKETKLQSLAMIHHVHGDKPRRTKRSFFRLTRMSDMVETNWSLWHLSWSILWRVVLIVLLVRILATLTISLLGNLI